MGKSGLKSCLQAAGFCINSDKVSGFITWESLGW